MTAAAEDRPVVLPGHAAVLQPAAALEHTLGENDVHLPHRMDHTPQIHNGLCAAVQQEIVEVHLVEHPLDVGQADLKGGVDSLPTKCPVHHLGVLFGDQPLPVKAGDGDLLPPLHPVVSPGAARASVVLHRDDRGIICLPGGVVDDHHPVGPVDTDAVHPHAAREHQAVVGVELAELAVPNLHVHLDPPAHLVVHVLPEEGQLRLPAHIAGAFKGQIAVLAGAEVQVDTLRPEHVPGLLLPEPLNIPQTTAVKDTGEVHVENHVGQPCEQVVLSRLIKAVPMQHTHDLEEQRIAVLLVQGGTALAPLRGCPVKDKAVLAVLLDGATHHGPGGQFKNPVSGLGHAPTSCQFHSTTGEGKSK